MLRKPKPTAKPVLTNTDQNDANTRAIITVVVAIKVLQTGTAAQIARGSTVKLALPILNTLDHGQSRQTIELERFKQDLRGQPE